jgi:hypothetical protein
MATGKSAPDGLVEVVAEKELHRVGDGVDRPKVVRAWSHLTTREARTTRSTDIRRVTSPASATDASSLRAMSDPVGPLVPSDNELHVLHHGHGHLHVVTFAH